MGSLLFSVWAGTLAMMVPHVWPYLHANLSNRFTSALLLAALIARCHGYGAGGSRRGVFTHFQLGYALGVSGLLVVLVVTWPEISVRRALAQGDVTALLQAMDTHDWHQGHSRHACSALATFAGTSVNNSEVLASSGGITRLLNSMEQHPAAAEVQASASAALALMARNNTINKARILENKGVVRALQAMRDHGENAEVQIQGCAVLTELAVGDERARADISRAGGIMRVILMLRAHSMHGAVQAAGCAVLRSLAASDACKLEAAEAGGLQLVADALKLHLDYPPLALHACWALRNLAGIDENRGRIAQTGAIALLVDVVAAYAGRDPGIVEHAAGALRNLAVNADDNKRRIIDANGLARLVHALNAHPDHLGVQDAALWALMIIAWSDGALQRQVAAAGAQAVARSFLDSPAAIAAPHTCERARTLLGKLPRL